MFFGTYIGGFGTGSQATTSEWTDTMIRCTVPEMTPQSLTIRVTVQTSIIPSTYEYPRDSLPRRRSSAAYDQQRLPCPGPARRHRCHLGQRLPLTTGTSTLTFGATAAAITSWSDTSIVCTVPAVAAGATTVTVTVGGQTSNAFAFTVEAPAPPAPLIAGVRLATPWPAPP